MKCRPVCIQISTFYRIELLKVFFKYVQMRLSVLVSTQAFFICFMILKIQTVFSEEPVPNFTGCEHIRWREGRTVGGSSSELQEPSN